MKNFWLELSKPILALAPMADVTDAAFRHVIAKCSKKFSPEGALQGKVVMFTEFVSASGLALAPEKGRKKLLKDLEYSEIERPIVAQFFTSNPDHMKEAAMLAVEFGFDGVDINMGCPDKSVEKQGAGAALIKNPKLAQELIRAAKEGVAEETSRAKSREKIPVSVKTRLGYNEDNLETWLPHLLAERPAAIIIHARTRKEMSKVPAKWERIKKAVEIRNSFPPSQAQKGTDNSLLGISSSSGQSPSLALSGPATTENTLIIGNGDVRDVAHAYELAQQTGADGVMLGRAIFGTPWLFANLAHNNYGSQIEHPAKPDRLPRDILNILLEHTKLFEEKFSGIKSFSIMKKHFKSYLSHLNNSEIDIKELKNKLMEANNSREVEQIISNCI